MSGVVLKLFDDKIIPNTTVDIVDLVRLFFRAGQPSRRTAAAATRKIPVQDGNTSDLVKQIAQQLAKQPSRTRLGSASSDAADEDSFSDKGAKASQCIALLSSSGKLLHARPTHALSKVFEGPRHRRVVMNSAQVNPEIQGRDAEVAYLCTRLGEMRPCGILLVVGAPKCGISAVLDQVGGLGTPV